jgi:hypothetical protein
LRCGSSCYLDESGGYSGDDRCKCSGHATGETGGEYSSVNDSGGFDVGRNRCRDGHSKNDFDIGGAE